MPLLLKAGSFYNVEGHSQAQQVTNHVRKLLALQAFQATVRNWHSVFFPDAEHVCSASSRVLNDSCLGNLKMLAEKGFREGLKLDTVSGTCTACQLEYNFEGTHLRQERMYQSGQKEVETQSYSHRRMQNTRRRPHAPEELCRPLKQMFGRVGKTCLKQNSAVFTGTSREK